MMEGIELVGQAGLVYNDVSQIPELEKLSKDYLSYRAKIVFGISEVASKYSDFLKIYWTSVRAISLKGVDLIWHSS